eukprot:TRINITY_DN5719_c0_g1_i1.p1 TRINITY_DN5719_c0_g1~~TRINITY_DN5719_c0_g1_i1.p1  ORF type:complete len:1211 (-),score=285.72 TRINITY_DN5719_c0_g1_i1:1497-5129(-)
MSVLRRFIQCGIQQPRSQIHTLRQITSSIIPPNSNNKNNINITTPSPPRRAPTSPFTPTAHSQRSFSREGFPSAPNKRDLDLAYEARIATLPRVLSTRLLRAQSLIRTHRNGKPLSETDLSAIATLYTQGNFSVFLDTLAKLKSTNHMSSQAELMQTILSIAKYNHPSLTSTQSFNKHLSQFASFIAESPHDDYRIDEGVLGTLISQLLHRNMTHDAKSLCKAIDEHGLMRVDVPLLEELARRLESQGLSTEAFDILRRLRKMEDSYIRNRQRSLSLIDPSAHQALLSVLQSISNTDEALVPLLGISDVSDESGSDSDSDWDTPRDDHSKHNLSQSSRNTSSIQRKHPSSPNHTNDADPSDSRLYSSLDLSSSENQDGSMVINLNALLDGEGDTGRIFQIANMLREQGAHDQVLHMTNLFPESNPLRSDRNFMANLMACVTASQHSTEKAMEVFERTYPDTTPDLLTYNYLLSLQPVQGTPETAETLFHKLNSAFNIRPNRTTYHNMMFVYSHAGQLDMMMKYYLEMKAMGIQPDYSTCNTIVDAFIREGDLEKARLVLDEFQADGIVLNNQPFNTLIDHLVESGEIAQALKIFFEMSYSKEHIPGVNPDVHMYNSLIEECIANQDLEGARLLYDSCLRDGRVYPNASTFDIILGSIPQTESLSDAATFLQDMRSHAVEPTLDIFERVMTALIECKRDEDALRVFEIARQRWKRIPSTLWNAAILATGGVGNKDDIRRIVHEMESEGHRSSSTTRNTIICAYGKAKEFAEAQAEFLKLIQGHKIRSSTASLRQEVESDDENDTSTNNQSQTSSVESAQHAKVETEPDGDDSVAFDRLEMEQEAKFAARMEAKLQAAMLVKQGGGNNLSPSAVATAKQNIPSTETIAHESKGSQRPDRSVQYFVRVNNETFHSIVYACDVNKQFLFLHDVIQHAIEHLDSPDPEVFCEMLRCCYRNGKSDLAWQLFQRLKQPDAANLVDGTFWNTVLQGIGGKASFEQCEELYSEGFSQDPQAIDLHMTFLMICGIYDQIETGLVLATKLSSAGVVGFQDSIQSMMIGASAHGKGEFVESLMRYMRDDNIQIGDAEEHFAVISVAKDGCDVDEKTLSDLLQKCSSKDRRIGRLTAHALLFVANETKNDELGLGVLQYLKDLKNGDVQGQEITIDPVFFKTLVESAEQNTESDFAKEILCLSLERKRNEDLAVERILQLLKD